MLALKSRSAGFTKGSNKTTLILIPFGGISSPTSRLNRLKAGPKMLSSSSSISGAGLKGLRGGDIRPTPGVQSSSTSSMRGGETGASGSGCSGPGGTNIVIRRPILRGCGFATLTSMVS